MGDIMVTDLPHRNAIWLQDYDYSQAGYYFITICVENRRIMLWSDVETASDDIPLSEVGKMIETALRNIETIYSVHF